MNSYLLDTHVVIWWLIADKRLKKPIVELLENSANELFISSVSLHEFAIKDGLGKMPISSQALRDACQKTEVKILNFDYSHMVKLSSLPRLHSDPFDRAIIAQSLSEDLPLISADAAFAQYQPLGLTITPA